MTQTVTALLATEGCLFACTLPLHGMRLLDLLNDPATDYLQLLEFKVFHPGCDTPVKQARGGIIRKTKVDFAVLDDSKHESQQRRTLAYTPKSRHDVFLTVHQYLIEGQVHLKGHPDSIAFLNHETSSFIPITQASVTYSGTATQTNHSQLVIANKSSIDLFQLKKQEQSPEDLLDSLRELIRDC